MGGQGASGAIPTPAGCCSRGRKTGASGLEERGRQEHIALECNPETEEQDKSIPKNKDLSLENYKGKYYI